LADAPCWERANQPMPQRSPGLAGTAAKLHQFGVCARLLPDC
jgi:hypothetical protein